MRMSQKELRGRTPARGVGSIGFAVCPLVRRRQPGASQTSSRVRGQPPSCQSRVKDFALHAVRGPCLLASGGIRIFVMLPPLNTPAHARS
jgi:hypothetical protein